MKFKFWKSKFDGKEGPEILNEEYERFKYEAERMNMEDISPHNQVGIRDTITLAPWYARYLLYIALTCIVIFITGIVGALLPFNPYTFYSWNNIPQTVCAEHTINVDYASSLERGPYTVSSLRGSAVINNADTGRPVDAWPIEDSNPQYHDYQVAPSYVERTAPSQSGEYTLGFHVTVRGYMFGVVPTKQEVDATSEETIVVLDQDDPKCQEN